mmetsp:Transcript_21651/g.50617  ORF Transcript_21651/g.50617 Transcript_21651/m.50617 type:complete len:99 (+) Transcript_21651:409-705(+)
MKHMNVMRNGSAEKDMATATAPRDNMAMRSTGTMTIAGEALPHKAKAEDPHMQAIMNKEKTRPCGSGSSLESNAGVQLKTKQNIEPSKAQTTIPIRVM